MADVLILSERIRNTIQQGESHFREFKSAYEGPPDNKKPRRWADICRDIAEALVAFANADGGDLLIGVEDDGTITGVPHTAEEEAHMLHAVVTHVHQKSQLPINYRTALSIDEKRVLFFSVSKGTTGIFQLSDGRCVKRNGTVTEPASIEHILFDRREVRSRAYDSEFVDEAQMIDLDIDRLRLVVANSTLPWMTPEPYLQQVGLAEYAAGGLRLRRAALLLFAKDIRRWHPRCQVRVLKVAGTVLGTGTGYNVSNDQVVEGNILELLSKTWDALTPFLAYKTDFGSGALFEQRFVYPQHACLEALTNAIAHRDYGVQRSIDIFIYDDRMEIKSPGALLSTLTIDQLYKLEGVHESRNALIARVLRENKYMRELGEGMQRIFQLMERNDLKSPDLCSDQSSFAVTLYNQSIFTQPQLAWLSMFDSFALSREQKRIVVAGMYDKELSPRDIYQAMNTHDRNIFDREVTQLRQAQILVSIRRNVEATLLSKKTGKPKDAIARFKVRDPNNGSPSSTQVESPHNKIAVFGLPLNTSVQELIDFLSPYGTVSSVEMPPTQAFWITRYGFVTFANTSIVSYLVTQNGRLTLRNHSLKVTPFKPK